MAPEPGIDARIPGTSLRGRGGRMERGDVPDSASLRLHNGTIYRWNRPIYDVVDDQPHIRVENRVLPAGPTVVDTLANAAFYYGLLRVIADDERPLWTQMSFSAAQENFQTGARDGIMAPLYWPGLGDGMQSGPEQRQELRRRKRAGDAIQLLASLQERVDLGVASGEPQQSGLRHDQRPDTCGRAAAASRAITLTVGMLHQMCSAAEHIGDQRRFELKISPNGAFGQLPSFEALVCCLRRGQTEA